MASIKKEKDKNGCPVYRVSVSNGRGRRISRTFRPEPTWSARTINRELQKFSADLEMQLSDYEILTKSESVAEAAKMAAEASKIKTVKDYGDSVFMPEKALSIAEKSRLSYEQLLTQHIYPAIGDLPIDDVPPSSIKALLGKLRSEMAFSSVIKVHAVINGLFKSAVLDDTIDKNPMDKVPRPKQSKDEEVSDEPLSYTAEEARYIMSCLENEPLRWKVYVLLLIDTGCRRGEISGLRWKEIDFDSSTITIDRNLQYSPAKGTYVTTPKGRKKRIVDLSHKVVELLLQLQEEQDPKSEWVFTQKRSTLPIHPDTPNKFSKRFEKKYGIEHFHPHKLRHTSASIAITNGADVVSVAARLGHADSSTTLRMYAHANSESIRKAGQVVRDAILTKDTDEKSP